MTKGQGVRFRGYWVSAVQGKIEVVAGEFDDTELSEQSGWTEALQNEDHNHPHGFLDPLTMLHDLSKKIAGEIDADELELAATRFRQGAPCPVNDIEDLARLIQLIIPKALPMPSRIHKSSPPTEECADDLPVE